MLGTAGDDGAGKLDAIVYRAGADRFFYVSEHGTSVARGRDIDACLGNLAEQVRADAEAGVCPPEEQGILHTFITTIDVQLALRDGRRRQPFICRVDEALDGRGRVSFEAQCPTNYLRESGRSIADAAARLGEVISARYEDERLTDLVRELPKRPMMTSIRLRQAPEARWVSAAIRRENGGYEARSLEAAPADVAARGSDPFAALRHLEAALGKADLSGAPIMKGEPVYCTLDVPLHLKENVTVRRFFVPVCRYNGSSRPFYASFVPQAGLSLRAPTFDGALEAARDAIALEYRGKSTGEVAQALKKPIMLTSARVNSN